MISRAFPPRDRICMLMEVSLAVLFTHGNEGNGGHLGRSWEGGLGRTWTTTSLTSHGEVPAAVFPRRRLGLAPVGGPITLLRSRARRWNVLFENGTLSSVIPQCDGPTSRGDLSPVNTAGLEPSLPLDPGHRPAALRERERQDDRNSTM